MSDELDKIWENQAAFNCQIRPHPTTFEAKSLVTSELVLAATDELHELLRTTKWKKHRRPRRYEVNMAHTTEEVVDTFIDLVTLCQVWDISPEMLMDGYWAKMAVNRQRYSEEWVKNHIDGPVIILDLDNVLCDYIAGFGRWLLRELEQYNLNDAITMPIETRVVNGLWLDAKSCGLDPAFYDGLKHKFRTTGMKRTLPVMPGAAEFVSWCRQRAMVILLTARPIDRYPNMLTDTVCWLEQNNIRVDHIWWGADKGKVVEVEEIQKHVWFAVDDIVEHCNQYSDKDVVSYWYVPRAIDAQHASPIVKPVKSFAEIMEREG